MDGAKSHGSEPDSMLCGTGSSIDRARHSTRGPRHAPEGPFSPPDPRESCTVDLQARLNEYASEASARGEFEAFARASREWREHVNAFPGYRLDLRSTNLQGADLSNGCFVLADFRDSKLDGANLQKVKMTGALLQNCTLIGSDIRHAIMGTTHLEEADLRGTQSFGANLDGAWLHGADLREVEFRGVKIRGAEFGRALRLEEHSIPEADLRRASLVGGDARGTRFSQDQLNSCFGDGGVALPPGTSRPRDWPSEALPPAEAKRLWRKRRGKQWRTNPDNYPPPDPQPETE